MTSKILSAGIGRNTKGSIPADLRSEHYGVIAGISRSLCRGFEVGKSLKQRVPLLLVDKRSAKGYLRPEEQLRQGSRQEL